MSILIPTRLTLEQGNLRLIDLTQDGVELRIAEGVDRETALNRWFSRHVPREPWQLTTSAERQTLIRPIDTESPTRLYAIDFPKSLHAEFWENHSPNLFANESDESRKSALDAFRRVLLETLATLPGFEIKAIRTFDIMVGASGNRSTAFDARSGEFVGLHLDDHENLGFNDRSRGFQLLSINIGHAERYFQFVNHDTASLLKLVGGVSALPDDARSAASLVQTFLGSFPDCPIVRMTLQPGQGYIGVTQDFIHDGSTNTEGRPDVTCLLGGHFKLTAGASS